MGADCVVIATDVSAVFLDWRTQQQRAIRKTTPRELAGHVFHAGSMGPKVLAACAFTVATGHRAVIGSLDRIAAMLVGDVGTEVCAE